MKKLLFALLLTSPLLLTECHKKDPLPEEKLPTATQEGKNTIGFLLNGQPWTPKGYNGSSNYDLAYDPTFERGTFDLQTYRYPSQDANDKQTIALYANNVEVTGIGTYPFSNPEHSSVVFIERKTDCTYRSFGNGRASYVTGSLTITRLDKQAGIISGTFEFSLAQPGCDTVRVTKGRFDKKL